MLNENLKTIRKSKELSQEELAVKVNVVRQTISKWEQGLSVPDSDLLLAGSPYLQWDFSDPETAAVGTVFHAAEWLFVRAETLLFLGAVLAIFLTREKD